MQCEQNNNEIEQTKNINKINSGVRKIKVKYRNINIPIFLLNENNLIPLIKNFNGEYYPTDFELIDMRTLENLCKLINIEISKKILNEIKYKVLLGNHQLILQKRAFQNSLIIYSSVGDKNIIECILIYQNKYLINNEIEIIKYKGIKNYLSEMCINFNTNALQYLVDENLTKTIGKTYILNIGRTNINDNRIHLLLKNENQIYKKK